MSQVRQTPPRSVHPDGELDHGVPGLTPVELAGLPILYRVAVRSLARLLPGAEFSLDRPVEQGGAHLVIRQGPTRSAVMWGNLLIAGPEVVARAMLWLVERSSQEDQEASG